MRQKLCRRLEEREKISAAAERISGQASADSVMEGLRATLRANNFQQEPNESLAQTIARFQGIRTVELLDLLAEPACPNPGGARA